MTMFVFISTLSLRKVCQKRVFSDRIFPYKDRIVDSGKYSSDKTHILGYFTPAFAAECCKAMK